LSDDNDDSSDDNDDVDSVEQNQPQGFISRAGGCITKAPAAITTQMKRNQFAEGSV